MLPLLVALLPRWFHVNTMVLLSCDALHQSAWCNSPPSSPVQDVARLSPAPGPVPHLLTTQDPAEHVHVGHGSLHRVLGVITTHESNVGLMFCVDGKVFGFILSVLIEFV